MQIDLTGVAVSFISGFFSILSIVVVAMVNSHIKDQQAAASLAEAVQNAVGAMQQAADQVIDATHPKVTIPGVPDNLAVGVQYVLDHAGTEAARFGITPELIAQKINAQIGLYKLDAKALGGTKTPDDVSINVGGSVYGRLPPLQAAFIPTREFPGKGSPS